MPTIQQERGVKTVAGLPSRWGRRAYRELSAALRDDGPQSERYQKLAALLDEVTAAPFPLDATDAHICVLAERYASDCATHGAFIHEPAALRARMAHVCRTAGIEPPTVAADAEAIARCTDPMWWRRSMRRVHGRAIEAAAIRLGFVSVRAGAYASDETVSRRMAQVARNRKALESVTITNDDGYECTLAEAASKTTSNPRIRRGELMLRLAGCEAVAKDMQHVGLFVTTTAPSRFHAVLAASGVMNPKYDGSTPREAQKYMAKVWTHTRADYGREGIKPYGFRIAEPHHDGCVHWHMLLFMRADQVETFKTIVTKHALKVDGDEPGARTNRVKFEQIDPAKGSAAAYLAKYISKNINDDNDAAHDEVIGADGQPVKIEMPANNADRASQRVDAWASVWSIRQFQPIGQPPVTVWRELRRVSEEAVADASPAIRMAWKACQRVERADPETGEVLVERPADFADYLRAQGGVNMGRDYRIAIAKEEARVEGRYGVRDALAPVGVYERIAPDVTYKSTRHTWTRSAASVGVRRSWSPVNNCTASDWPGRPKAGNEWFSGMAEPGPVADFDDCWFSSDEFRHVFIEPAQQVDILERAVASAFDQQARSRAAKTGNPHGSIGAKTQGFGA